MKKSSVSICVLGCLVFQYEYLAYDAGISGLNPKNNVHFIVLEIIIMQDVRPLCINVLVVLEIIL